MSSTEYPEYLAGALGSESLGIAAKPDNSTTWINLGASFRALHESSALFPPLQSAVGTLAGYLDVLEAMSKNRKEYEDLASDLTVLSNLLVQHTNGVGSIRMSDSISNILLSIEKQAKYIQRKCDRGGGKGLLEARIDEDDLYKSYRRIEVLFRQLQTDAILSALSLVEEQTTNARLDSLAPAKLANYDSKLSAEISRRACTEETRTDVLSGLDNWSYDLDGADVYWMNGMAGTGKTTIAYSFSKRLEERKQLAASFFCTRTSAECRDVTRIVPTVVYQLARYSIPFRSALCQVLGNDPDISSKSVQTQFDRILKEPLLKAKGAIPNDLVVTIDALDECDDKSGTKLILDLLFQFATDLPLKFFVTSRPEPEISNRMRSENSTTRSVMYLHDIEESVVQADIMRYLKEELASISPTSSEIRQLVQRSGKLFIYAATLVRYIRPSMDPRQRLESVLAMTSHSTLMHTEIDKLYTAILTEVFNKPNLEEKEIELMRLALHTVLCVQEPLDIVTLSQLIGLEKSRVLLALQPVESVIQFSEDSGIVSTLHASFPDFMFDPARSGHFCCNVAGHHDLLGRRCFEIMKKQLKFNICNIESSFVPDADVEGLPERIQQAISPTLYYSCCYWGHHLQRAVYLDSLCLILVEFLSVRLLFWMEVMNLKHGMSLGLETFFKAGFWLRDGTDDPDARGLVNDARDFVTSFAYNPVCRSSAHIYISALAFDPISSSVRKAYQQKFRGLIKMSGSFIEMRGAGALATWDIQSPVKAIAYSPDGSCVAVGCGTGTIKLHNAHDGVLRVNPLEGHTSYVSVVAYSADGAYIASGSADFTIRVWSAHDGAPIGEPLEGHTGDINSLAYSHDSTRIVSGSNDGTIRIWCPQASPPNINSFEHDRSAFLSVAYSPDSSLVVSSSADARICIWDARDGRLAVGPFGYDDGWFVRSVAFSPDGMRIISGSNARNIRVWSAIDGTLVAGPFVGHTGWVTSVACSPDGTSIVSGSEDNTIRVWGAHDGTLVAGPFSGHTNFVTSVAYSTDGSRIISGSEDGTIRVWSAHGGRHTLDESETYVSTILSVGYSPDGTRVLASFSDNTLRIWSAVDGKFIAGPIGEISSSIFGAASLSPDGNRIVSIGHDRSIQVLSARDATLIAGPFQAYGGGVTHANFSFDANFIVTTSYNDTICIMDAQDGTLVAGPFEYYNGPVPSAAVSPDGTHVVCKSLGNSIRAWALDPNQAPFGVGYEANNPAALPSNATEPLAMMHDWTVQADGWVMDSSKSRLLFWVPSDMVGILPTPRSPFVILPRGSLSVDYSDMLIGERWHECYISN